MANEQKKIPLLSAATWWNEVREQEQGAESERERKEERLSFRVG